LLKQLEEWRKLHHDSTLSAEELSHLISEEAQIEKERSELEEKTKQGKRSVRAASLSLEEIRTRTQRVMAEIEALRKAPPLKQTLRYRTPVSHPLQSEELLFECRRGRIALIDIGGFIDDIQQVLNGPDGNILRDTGQYSGVTEARGPFRLRYVLEMNAINSRPACSWEVEPLTAERGESLEKALSPGSEFRRIIDSIEPAQTAVTLCVYPDSFELYRKLRDFMHERDIVVAGRALPEGASIAASRHGTASRGQ
jgi:hypothetical protein